MIEKDLLTLRLEGVNTSQERSRTAFFAAVIASAVVLLVCFNVTLSQTPFPTDPASPTQGIKFEALEKEEAKHYYERFSYALPVLGVQVSTDDLSIFGPLAILIFGLYYAACLRSTLTQLKCLDEQMKRGCDDENQRKVAVVLKSQIVLNSPKPAASLRKGRLGAGLFSIKSIYRFLIYLPSLACVAAMTVDIHGTFFSHAALDPTGTIVYDQLSVSDKHKAIGSELVGACATLIVVVYSMSASRDSREISEILGERTKE